MLNKYIKYTFYDDNKRLIAIVYRNIPKEVMEQLLQEYAEVKFEEQIMDKLKIEYVDINSIKPYRNNAK